MLKVYFFIAAQNAQLILLGSVGINKEIQSQSTNFSSLVESHSSRCSNAQVLVLS